MLIIYYDENNKLITVEVDSMGVNFCDFVAYFTDIEDKEYSIKLEKIVACCPITEKEV